MHLTNESVKFLQLHCIAQTQKGYHVLIKPIYNIALLD